VFECLPWKLNYHDIMAFYFQLELVFECFALAFIGKDQTRGVWVGTSSSVQEFSSIIIINTILFVLL
jgi:hypothetical protein